MMVPSGNGSCPSREALIATSLPRMARRSLSLPSSWATEINLQSRYPGGILIPKIGELSSSGPPAETVIAPITLTAMVAAITQIGICFMDRRVATPTAAELARKPRRSSDDDVEDMFALLVGHTSWEQGRKPINFQGHRRGFAAYRLNLLRRLGAKCSSCLVRRCQRCRQWQVVERGIGTCQAGGLFARTHP